MMRLSFTNPLSLLLFVPFISLLALPLARHKTQHTLRHAASAILRLLIGALLILSLSGAQLARPVDGLTVVFVLDLSDSVSASEQGKAHQFIQQAIAEMPTDHQAAIVVFGEDALIERLASDVRDLPPITSVPRTGHTDIASAIRLGLALFDEESQKRLVLLSDGLENAGDAVGQADLAAARDIEIDIVPLSTLQEEQEAYVAKLETPPSVRQRQSFAVEAIVESSSAQQAKVYLLGDGRLLAAESVSLQPGGNHVEIPLTAEASGFHRYQMELIPTTDTLPQNNHASGFTVVYGPPRVLIVEGGPDEADALSRALASTEIDVTVVPPPRLSTNLTKLAGYDAIVLANVPASEIYSDTMDALPVAVRELGRGLVMVGGERSFGAGGYRLTPVEEALPIDMDLSRSRVVGTALALVIDKSGSMADTPCMAAASSSNEYTLSRSNWIKIDIAKDAAIRAASALQPSDSLGVVAFDDSARWAFHLQPVADIDALEQAIAGIPADGGTNIWAGLVEAERDLATASEGTKHMILLTDGWADVGDYDTLTARMANEGITLSIVAVGCDTAEYLPELAEKGGGRYYEAPTMQDVPQIFLQEVAEVAGSYIVEESFYLLQTGTTPILRGLDPATLPGLQGYNSTTSKATAQTPLISFLGEPVLAQWQHGLGRSVAWTSDLKGQWAIEWVEWDQFNTFVAQLIGWTLPDPADEGLQVALQLDGTDVHLLVNSVDKDGRPRDLLETEAKLVGPDLANHTVSLEQVGAGRYEGTTLVGEPGAYMVQIVQRDQAGHPVAQRMTGLVVPYSPEYRRSGQGSTLLGELARTTGGNVLESPSAAFAPTQQRITQARPLWPLLMLLAALLFPADVAVRRLRLAQSDWHRMATWLRARAPRRRVRQRAIEPEILSDLFQARERVRRRRMRPSTKEATGASVSAVARSPQEPLIIERPSSPADPSIVEVEDSFARLRQARARARRRR
jgi:Ca-activated chloride channel family protein